MQNILVLEDDAALGSGISLALRSPDVQLTHCTTISQARVALTHNRYDLLILDVNLPDGSGLALLKEIRKTDSLPVILLTANDMETDIVTGLESGADDYITKPFSLAVLRARVNTQLRRSVSVTSGTIEIDSFSFDFDRMEFRKGDQPIELSKTEQKLLRMLVENRGQTLSRSALVDRIWTDGAEYVDENALSVTVKRLRDKLGADCIGTVYGLGYVWKGAKI